MPVSCLLVQDASLGHGGIAKTGGSLIFWFYPFIINPDVKLTSSLFTPVLVTSQK